MEFNYKTIIKRILVIFIILFTLVLLKPIHSQEGAYTVGYSNTSASTSITLPSGSLYLCEASANGATLTSSFTVLANSSNYAVVGYSSTNSCSITTNAGFYTVGGITVNNFTSYTYVTNTSSYSNGVNAQVNYGWPISFTLTEPSSVYILISVGSTGNGAYISSVTLPAGCSQIFLTSSGIATSVYAAYCQDLSPGTYTVDAAITVNARVNKRTPTNMYGASTVFIFPIFLFNMSSSPSTITQIPGQSNTTTIYVNEITNANPLPVNLSCTTNNPDLSCSLSPSTVTPNGTATLTITSTYNIAPGTYLVNVTGTAPNNATNYTIITVNIPPETISVSSSNVQVIPGKYNTTTITASDNYGYGLNISVSCPTGFTCTISPNPIPSEGSTTLNISASTTVTPGNYIVNITAKDVDTGNYNTTSITVTVPQEVITVSTNPPYTGITPGGSTSITVTASDNYEDNLNLSCSVPSSWSCKFSSNIISSGSSSTLTITASSNTSPGTYLVNITATDTVTSTYNTTSVTVVVETLTLTLNQTSASVNSGQTIYVQVNGTDNLGDNITIECLAPSGVICSPTEVNISSGESYIFSITAPNVNSYQQYNITFIGKDTVTGLENSTIFTLNVYPNPIIYISSPANNTISNYYALNITFYTNYPTVNVTINGNTYTINVNPGTNTVYLRYNNSSNGLPGLYSIIPNGGNISIELTIQSPTGLTNSTGIYIYQLPPPEFNVSYISPTPSNGTVLDYWLLQVYGNVYDNTLGTDYCAIQFLNQSNNQWITVSNSTQCSDVFFDGILQQYATFNGKYYQLWYRIYANNNYGLTYITSPQVIYYQSNAVDVYNVTPTESSTQINGVIQGAINNNTPVVVFTPGVYLVNLLINPQGKNITLLGTGNVLFEPANPGLPVIDVESSNVTLNNINVQTNLFAVRLDNGTLNIYNSNINSGLFAIQVENPSVLNIYNSNINGNIGAIYGTGTFQNSTIENSYITASVWGIYDLNPENVIINNDTINANIFGVDFDGNAINNYVENNNVIANIFGIKINNGYNNNILNNYITANIFGIDLGSSGNNVNNDTINVGSVFGLYESAPNNISNVITYGGVFGLNIVGNATNISSYNSQLGVSINGQGYIDNLTVSTGSIDILYNGNAFINYASGFSSTITNNSIQYNFASGILLIGSPIANITFIDIPSGNYIVEKIISGVGNVISTNTTFSPSGFGVYALYYS
ncbi:hypothetical protein YN1_0200 [Nanoarchaeota archaeon]